MPDEFSLESLLQNRAGAPECSECAFWDNYVAMKKYLKTYYYPWIHDNCPWYTDHGQKHVDSVIHTAAQLVSSASAEELTCLEVYLLLVAIIWHDVGMVAKRSGHAQETTAFINKVGDFCFPDQTVRRLVSLITRAHSGREGWGFLESSEHITPCTHKTCTVYPRSLAALLRFADEASETRTRISPPLLDKVPDDHRLYWEYAHVITASKPEPLRCRLVLAVEVQRTAAHRRFPCPKEPEFFAHEEGGSISLIEYIVCRLEKMNNERAYCFPYLTRYADIRSIEVRLRVCEGTDCKTFDGIAIGDGSLSSTSDYPSIDLFERFFEAYPQLKPSVLEGGGN